MAPSPWNSEVSINRSESEVREKSSAQNVLEWMGRVSILVIGAYVVSDWVTKWRQGKVNERAEVQELLGDGVDKDEWMQATNRTELVEICRHEPGEFLDRLVMLHPPGSHERQELLIILRIANPEWCRRNGVNMTEILFWED